MLRRFQIPPPLRWTVRGLPKNGGLSGKSLTYWFHRFASQAIAESEKIPHLTALVRTYLSTMADIGVETWLMHGTLLGWWWNQKVVIGTEVTLRLPHWADSVSLIDLPVGYRHRCSSFRNNDVLPRQVLQHDRVSF